MKELTEEDYLEYAELMKKLYEQMVTMAIKIDDRPILRILGAFGVLFGGGTEEEKDEASDAMESVIDKIIRRMEGNGGTN